MGQQSVRQAARREVMEALAARRRERAEQEKRLEDLGGARRGRAQGT